MTKYIDYYLPIQNTPTPPSHNNLVKLISFTTSSALWKQRWILLPPTTLTLSWYNQGLFVTPPPFQRRRLHTTTRMVLWRLCFRVRFRVALLGSEKCFFSYILHLRVFWLLGGEDMCGTGSSGIYTAPIVYHHYRMLCLRVQRARTRRLGQGDGIVDGPYFIYCVWHTQEMVEGPTESSTHFRKSVLEEWEERERVRVPCIGSEEWLLEYCSCVYLDRWVTKVHCSQK